MFTVADLIKDLQMLDQDSPVLVGCMWARGNVREFIEDNFDEPVEVTDKITDAMIDELMGEIECIDNFDNDVITDLIWKRIWN